MLRVLIAVSILSGCALESSPSTYGLVVGYKWLGGDYESLFADEFGEDANYSGINFYKLSNAWNHVEPNALNIGTDGVKYIRFQNDRKKVTNLRFGECPELIHAAANFHEQLFSTLPIAIGKTPHHRISYLDPPDYLIEAYTRDVKIRLGGLDPSLPVVAAARNIKLIVEECESN